MAPDSRGHPCRAPAGRITLSTLWGDKYPLHSAASMDVLMDQGVCSHNSTVDY